MTGKQEDTLTMFYSVQTVNDAFKAIWSSNAAFVATEALFRSIISKVEVNRDTQLGKDNSSSVKKKTLKDETNVHCLYISNRLQSFANATNNKILASKAKVTKSELNMARDTLIMGIWNNILSLGEEYINSLVDYDVDADRLAAYKTCVSNYAAIVSEPSNETGKGSTITSNIEKFIKEGIAVLDNRMDLDIEVFKDSSPDYYEQYKKSRFIKSTARTGLSLIGSAKSKETGESLKGVLFVFTLPSDGKVKSFVLEKVTADKGSFRVPNLSDGVYQIVVSKIGYKTQTLTITITNEETYLLSVDLEKE